MIYWNLFLAFFIPGILGYGGGPGTIPLVEKEVVDRYGWMNHQEFSEMIALGNALPGPIATKMAGYVGFVQGGVLGSAIAIFAIVAPTLILMIGLLSILQKYKDSPKVKQLSQNVRPVIAVLLGVLAYDFLFNSFQGIGGWQTFIIALLSYFFLEFRKVHPAYVILGALVYGALFLG
ncbi:chromate transporter [Fervidibacillus halotolerans]|uniref:Chromate transporter n=1 Tax=Fervidibacillus halotolerans TaxID=2980027 RepID=A0A9E8LZT4_9BACI|nr:chromate transporter [Fervidibacillus halotolerans]WAA12011.1 chromate transporter [Fervidibacillus halotolerans]